MARTKIDFIDVFLEEKNKESVIQEILARIRPSWNLEELHIQDMSAGFLNLVYACRRREDDPSNSVIVKTTAEYFMGPMAAFQGIYELLNKEHMGPKTLAKFKNGIVSDFVVGECLSWNSPRLKVEQNWKQLAEIFAQWHCRALYRQAKQLNIRTTLCWLIVDVEKRWPALMEREPMKSMKDELPTVEELQFEQNDLLERMKGELEPALVHSDINGSNVIERPSGELCFIDMDWVGIHWSEYDLAWYFTSYWDKDNPLPTLTRPSFSLCEKMKFLTHYLQRRKLLDQGVKDVPTVIEIEQLYDRVEKVKLMCWLRIIVAVCFITDFNERAPGFIPFIKKLWREYPKEKRRLFDQTLYDE